MLHFRDESWDLNAEVCPCDVQFLEFLEERGIRDAAIFHFGTGNHHLVGIRNAENGSNNAVLGITASPPEHESYVKLAIANPRISHTYKVVFGDIYQLDARLLPAFDVVTLFHLCEFRGEENDAYGAMTDLDLTLMMTDKLKPGGWLLFYKDSMAFDRARHEVAKLERMRPLEHAGDYKTLLLYRKAP
jgi:hypothetical protein